MKEHKSPREYLKFNTKKYCFPRYHHMKKMIRELTEEISLLTEELNMYRNKYPINNISV